MPGNQHSFSQPQLFPLKRKSFSVNVAVVAPTPSETTNDREQPRTEYQRLKENYDQQLQALNEKENKVALSRGLIFAAAFLLLIFCSQSSTVSGYWLLLPLVVFIGLVLFHGRLLDRIREMKHAAKHYHDGLNRINDDWSGTGSTGEQFVNSEHPYSSDLDLFGTGSLFQLISQARTEFGEETLANWLSAPSDAETISKRQTAIQELSSYIDLREKIALLPNDPDSSSKQNQLQEWLQIPAKPLSRFSRVFAGLCGLTTSSLLLLYLATNQGAGLLGIVLLIQAPFLFHFRKQLHEQSTHADEAADGLKNLSQVLLLIEQHSFQAPYLKELKSKLDTDGHPPSYEIHQLDKQVQRLQNCTRNQFFAPIGFLLCLPVHIVHAIETWKLKVGSHVNDWLEAVGEFEALSSLANFAYEHPDFHYPTVIDSPSTFDAKQMGHPLLPGRTCIKNDLQFGTDPAFLMVSGSNMSGKSTMLRTVGLNSVLAYTGAPVRAESFTISPFLVATTMRVSDSLQQGHSHFFAVISRLKKVVELTNEKLPVLFLLDEILQGTNSHDRREGAEAVIRNLLNKRAVGLVTTHDLSLTKIVPDLPVPAQNIHFEDRLEEGKLVFDYQVKEGVVQHSNALELMKMVGLTRSEEKPADSLD